MKHNDLIKLAIKWLKNNKNKEEWHKKQKCTFVISELVTHGCLEIPDAIGFSHNCSILIECKLSIQDYKKDLKKSFRYYENKGIGNYRLYLTPVGLLKNIEINNKWGLLETDGKNIFVKQIPCFFPNVLGNEKGLFYSLIRRVVNNKEYLKYLK